MDAAKLQHVYDVLEIQRLKAMYYEIVDTIVTRGPQEAERFKEILLPDVKGEYPMVGVLQGRDAVAKFLSEGHTRNEWMWHGIHTPRIDVTGDTAVARWTVIGRSKRRSDGGLSTAAGRLHDDWRRTPDGWRISYLRFMLEGVG